MPHGEIKTWWWAGMVECRVCCKVWAAVVGPVAKDYEPNNLECPNCGNMAGDPAEADDDG
jgi:hypothetical protein